MAETDTHTDGYCNLDTESAQWADSVKIGDVVTLLSRALRRDSVEHYECNNVLAKHLYKYQGDIQDSEEHEYMKPK